MTAANGRGWAYAGATLGAAVSIAANIAHSYVPPAGVAADWTPHAGAVIGAVFWPVGMFIAIEMLAKVPWPAGWRYALVRFLGLLPVAAVAAVVSYRHLSGLLTFYGEDTLTATIGPLAVDGLMVMATGALIATGRPRRVAPAEMVTPAGVEHDWTVDTGELDAVRDEWAADPWARAQPVSPAPVGDASGGLAVARRTASDQAKVTAAGDSGGDTAGPEVTPGGGVEGGAAGDTAGDIGAGDTRDRLTTLRRAQPTVTQAVAAEALGVHVRTVKRHWSYTAPREARARRTPAVKRARG